MTTKITNFLSRFNTEYFFSVPPDTKAIWYWLGLYIFLIYVFCFAYFYFYKQSKTDRPIEKYASEFIWVNGGIVLVGLVFWFFRFERLATLSWRIWSYLILLTVVGYNFYFLYHRRKKIKEEIFDFRNIQRKEKWLPKKKKR